MEKKSVWNSRMWSAVVLAGLMLSYPYLKAGPDWGRADTLYLITLPMATSMFGSFACVFPAFPYAFSFAEEYNSSFYRFALIRSGRKKYIWRKLFSVGISGGIMMVITFGFIFGIAVIAGVPTTEKNVSEFYLNTVWYPYIAVWGGKFVLLLKIILAFLFGVAWSSICLTFTIGFLNRYVAFIGTFVLYQFLWQALSGSIYNPVYLLRGDMTYTKVWQPFLIQIVVICVCGSVNWWGISRRIKNV